ncbi:MAG: glycosyltransferase [Elusimicrobia bacterium]|nr:glycosyltransferase [Elusimicrobiota bacterium]
MNPRPVPGTELLAVGNPDAALLGGLSEGPGDLWHSGLQRGAGGLLGELRYWSPVYWFYLNDVDPVVRGVSWRLDPGGFVVRASAWRALGGADPGYASDAARALDLGFRLLRRGGVPLHVPGLFGAHPRTKEKNEIPREDLYLFFIRHFKRQYRMWVLARESARRRAPLSQWRALRRAEARARAVPALYDRDLPARPLRPLPESRPSVSVIIPTLSRPRCMANLLSDYTRQTFLPGQIVVMDATPELEREAGLYELFKAKLPLVVLWQKSLGSCRARNEAIAACTGDVIVFGDDDIRIPPDFVENHVRLLETYKADGAVGLDIRADHPEQGLEDLARKLSDPALRRGAAGAAATFNNANSCVRREWVLRCAGNDVNFDGGYGEDQDFGHCLVEKGAVLLRNPRSADLHLKPAAGGFRWWQGQLELKGKARRRQPWELERQVGWISPRPSPTIMYGFLKHYTHEQLREWLYIYLARSWWPSYAKPGESFAVRCLMLVPRLLATPWVLLRIRESMRFAQALKARGPRYE